MRDNILATENQSAGINDVIEVKTVNNNKEHADSTTPQVLMQPLLCLRL